MYKQVLKDNKGITDIVEDRSETRKGFLYHSSFDFNHETIGNFYKVINRMVESKPNGTIVEMGCGSSIIAPYLPRTMTYVGLDGNPDSGVFARELNDPRCVNIVLDLTKEYKIEPNLEADFFISFDFFEHMEPENIDFVINKAEKLLAVGGKAFLIVDSMDLDEHLIQKPRQWWLDKFAINAPSWKLYDDPSFMSFYLQNVPPHWSYNVPQQHALLFERKYV